MTLDRLISELQVLKKNYDGDTEVEIYLHGLGTTLFTDEVRGVKKYNFKNSSRNSPSILILADE